MHIPSPIEPAHHCSRPADVSADSRLAMIDLLSGAVRFGRAALLPSGSEVAPKILPPPPSPTKKKTSNYAAVRVVSRAFQGTTDFALSFWDGLTPEERGRRRIVEERKTLLIFHMKNVRTTPQSRAPRARPREGTLGSQPQWTPYLWPHTTSFLSRATLTTRLQTGQQPRGMGGSRARARPSRRKRQVEARPDYRWL